MLRELGRILFQLEELMTDFECAEDGKRTCSEFQQELDTLHESISKVQDKAEDGILEIPSGIATAKVDREKHAKEPRRKTKAKSAKVGVN